MYSVATNDRKENSNCCPPCWRLMSVDEFFPVVIPFGNDHSSKLQLIKVLGMLPDRFAAALAQKQRNYDRLIDTLEQLPPDIRQTIRDQMAAKFQAYLQSEGYDKELKQLKQLETKKKKTTKEKPVTSVK